MSGVLAKGIISTGNLTDYNWTERTLPASENWTAIAYGNGLFVVVATNTNKAATSPDGITWTERTLPASENWRSVTYGDGLFLAVGSNNSNIAATSPDGINWTQRTLPIDARWSAVTYGNGLFVAVNSNTNIAAISPDGINWTERTLPFVGHWSAVTYGNGLFVAVVTGPDIDDQWPNKINKAATSPDGSTWTERTLPASESWSGVAYGNGLFIAVSIFGVAATSPNGITWTERTLPYLTSWILGGSDYLITYCGGLFVVVIGNNNNNITLMSLDGINWNYRTLTDLNSTNSLWKMVTYGNGLFVAVISNGFKIVTSPLDKKPNNIVYTVPPDTIFTGKVMVIVEHLDNDVKYHDININEISVISGVFTPSASQENSFYNRGSHQAHFGTSDPVRNSGPLHHLDISGNLELILGPNQDITISSNVPVKYLVTGYLSK